MIYEEHLECNHESSTLLAWYTRAENVGETSLNMEDHLQASPKQESRSSLQNRTCVCPYSITFETQRYVDMLVTHKSKSKG